MINKKLMSDAFSKNMVNVTEVTYYGRDAEGHKIMRGKFIKKKKNPNSFLEDDDE